VGKIHLQPFMAKQQKADGTPVSWESRVLWEQGVIPKLPLPYYGYNTVDYIGGHVHYVHGDYVSDVNARCPGTTQLLSREAAYHSLPEGETWRLSIPPELHYNHWIADRSIAFLDTISAQDNFFLVSSFPDPHHPFAACRPYSEQYDPDTVALPQTWNESEDPCSYLKQQNRSRWAAWDETTLRECIAQSYGMISHIDHNIGRVLDHLDAIGLTDNTIVVFTADHGEYLGTHHLLLKGPWPYEPVVRVPYIWRDPGARAQDPREDVVSLIDFAPTVLDYAGVDPERFDLRDVWASDPMGLPGRSLRSMIQGEADRDIGALIEYDEDFYPGIRCCRYRMLIASRFKLCIYGGTSEGVLFDLAADPQERHNLWDNPSYVQAKAELLAALADRLAETDRWDVARYSAA
jgi:arylsulfatase A-like enzyme